MSDKIFIGVAWPYANGSLHLGHIAGCYLPADIFARYNRMKGREVLMVSGSDEHGTPITITAENEKTTPQSIVDRYNKEHTDNMDQLGISFDLFTRTTTKNHESVVQDIFSTLYEKGHIYKKSIDAFYCENCSRFLPDRYIEGTCPYCHCEKARGDQCDSCGKLLDSSELMNVICKLCGGTPVKQSTDHLFFALSTFETKLFDWIEDKKHWKSNVLKFTYNWLKNGLQDRAITRDMSWGIKVPVSGYENKRIYVWFDAVIGYFAASKEWSKKQGKPSKWEEWWKNKDARHYYFLAKDNIPFHSIIWPSILIGYDESLNLPYDIPANEYLCLSGEQFSKSRSIAVWVPDILKKFDPDAIRYYLSINMPENKDSNWLWNDFVAKNNDELLGTYGNFVHRVITFTQKNFGHIPKKGNLKDLDSKALKKIEEAYKEVGDSIDNCNFKKGLRTTMNLAQFGNFYFDQNQPWNLIKNEKERCSSVLHICIKIVQALAVFMAPYLPFSSDTVWKILGNTDPIKSWDDSLSELKEGTPLEKPVPLFKKLMLEDIVEEADPFSKLDLRVAKIIDVEDHPQADKLYIMQLDLGPLGKRSIVAGIKTCYSKEELNGKSIVIVTNLKPAKIRGIVSKGMLLATEDEQGIISLLNPKDATPGAEIFVEGIPREPVSVLEFEDFKQAIMTIGDKQEVVYNRKPLKSKNNTVVTDKKVKIGAKVS
ncbi:MAG: methionine--tRNA ligase [Thermoplasmatales archaeon]|nr:MAG: methionine--tRNA ligase [Thermoplasmatales archaeon]